MIQDIAELIFLLFFGVSLVRRVWPKVSQCDKTTKRKNHER